MKSSRKSTPGHRRNRFQMKFDPEGLNSSLAGMKLNGREKIAIQLWGFFLRALVLSSLVAFLPLRSLFLDAP
jgi:hypothetical protein